MQFLRRLTCDFDQAKIQIGIEEDTKLDPSKHRNTILFIHSETAIFVFNMSVMKMLIEQHQVDVPRTMSLNASVPM